MVRDPRFSRDVGHVVVEFGGAAHQDVIDRYVNGEEVPYTELRQVWTETVGWVPTVVHEGYARFFGQVRQTNLTLPAEERIRVWLAEPPINWSEIDTMAEQQEIAATRDSHAANVILRDILGEGRKALVIYGAAHFDRTNSWEQALRAELAAADPDGPWSGDDATLRDLVEEEYPGSFLVAQTYRGFQNEECTRRFEEAMSKWPWPALALSIRETTLERAMRECLSTRDPNQMRFPPTIPEEVQDRARAIIAANAANDVPLLADSVIFIARAEDLTVATPFIRLALDEDWRAELSRRYGLMTGRPRPLTWNDSFPSAPLPYAGRD